MRVLVIGGVETTALTIKALRRHDIEICGALGYEPANTRNVSGWSNLRLLSNTLSIPYQSFRRINDECHQQWANKLDIDVIFAVGLSQLLDAKWNQMSRLGCIGFHPTFLPHGRGRAPVAWLVLEESEGAATFFLIGEAADDGPIFVQEPFSITSSDDAETVTLKMHSALECALDRWLPKLGSGTWDPRPQNEALASWHGLRKPEDGLIDWKRSAEEINRLIKATTRPHPGAYTYTKRTNLIIYKSRVEEKLSFKGSVGRVLLRKDDKYLIQCGDGLLWVHDLSPAAALTVGQKLGLNVEDEIMAIWKTLGEQRET
jgi:methionyl-tRNA formyltransferase